MHVTKTVSYLLKLMLCASTNDCDVKYLLEKSYKIFIFIVSIFVSNDKEEISPQSTRYRDLNFKR